MTDQEHATAIQAAVAQLEASVVAAETDGLTVEVITFNGRLRHLGDGKFAHVTVTRSVAIEPGAPR